jgi:hypothetical protein
MSGGIEAAGDLATGAIFARAVEPSAGEAAHAHGAGGLCLNCGTRLIGEHCHACGQSGHVHRTVGAIGHELLHGVFHFEGKIWRTLPMLALRPGELTRRYIAGERVRFVSPLAVFLFSVFLMFAVVANLPGWGLGDDLFKGGADGVAQARAKVAEERANVAERVRDLERDLAEERADKAADPGEIAAAERRLTDAREEAADLLRAERMLPAIDGARSPADDDWISAKWRHAKENPKLLLYKLKSSAYKYSWALIPLSVPFLWLLFPFSRRFGLYDHAVYATYSLSFMSLFATAIAILAALGAPLGLTATLATFVPVVHIYKQLKGAYGLGRLSALFRTWLLTGFIVWMIVPIFVLALIYLGIAD